MAKLESIHAEEVKSSSELNFRSVWLKNQIFKTMYQRGHYVELLLALDEIMK